MQIPFRTVTNPTLSPREINELISAMRDMPTSRRVYGSSLTDKVAEEPTIYVKVEATTISQFSVFAIQHDASLSHYRPFPISFEDILYNPISYRGDYGTIYCTNGGQKITAGAVYPCEIIGFTKPHIVAFKKETGQVANTGSRFIFRHTSGGGVLKYHRAGQFVAVSPAYYPNPGGAPNDGYIWVVRTDRITRIYGKTNGSLTYGSSGLVDIWRNEAVSSPLEQETVYFTWLGVSGNIIPSGTKVEAEWWDDLQAKETNLPYGGWRISNANCVAS